MTTISLEPVEVPVPSGPLRELSRYEHVLHAVALDGTYDDTDECVPVNDVEKANGFSSQVKADDTWGGEKLHTVAIDLDVPARLVASSTEGHSHLYIDALMPWSVYSKLLDVLAEAGVIEDGYRAASQRRGFTTLRLPWVSKTGPDFISLDRRMYCVGCQKHPSEITAYDEYALAEGMSGNAEYVWRGEGTLNRRNGHFRCDACYIAAGQPLGETP